MDAQAPSGGGPSTDPLGVLVERAGNVTADQLAAFVDGGTDDDAGVLTWVALFDGCERAG